jgi:hypothetical protein
MECQYCKNVFSSKTNLNNHQKTAKYCLKLQGNDDFLYNCNVCNKSFNRKFNLTRHEEKCVSVESFQELQTNMAVIKNDKDIYRNQIVDKDNQIQELKNQIKDLQKQMENIALRAVSRPTTSNKTQINNYIQNMRPVTDELLMDNVQHLTIDHIKKGAEGYAEYALEYPLKDSMLCSDYARRKVKFKDKDGNLITDPEMSVLARKFFSSIKEKNKELICKSANELKEKLGDDNVMDTVVKMFDYKSDIEKGSDGEKTDFHHDFVRQVCSQSIKE